jgi:hypothetical protein
MEVFRWMVVRQDDILRSYDTRGSFRATGIVSVEMVIQWHGKADAKTAGSFGNGKQPGP